MSPDPHVQKLLDSDYPYASKSPVIGRVVCVIDARSPNRGLELSPHPSRAVLRNEIHELILTDEQTAAPKATVNNIAYLCFFEIIEGGMILERDRVEVNGQQVGVMAGVDLTHFPNHLNIILKTSGELKKGSEMGLKPGDTVVFKYFKD